MQALFGNTSLIAISAAAIVILLLLAWNIILFYEIRNLQKKSSVLFAGKEVQNLEELLLSQAKTLSTLDHDIQELYTISNQINQLAFRGYHKIGLIRFNPFKDVGGDQSFAIAILNGKNNGITINSLFTREGTRVYAKSIIGGEAEKYPLTEEEKEAIKIAMKPK